MADTDRYPDADALPWSALDSDPTEDAAAANGPAQGSNEGTGPAPTVDDITGDDWFPYQPVDAPKGTVPEYEEEIDEVPPPPCVGDPVGEDAWYQLAECGIGIPLDWWINLAITHTVESIRIACRLYAVLRETERSTLPDGATAKTADESFTTDMPGFSRCGKTEVRYMPVIACIGGGTNYVLIELLNGILTGVHTAFRDIALCYYCTGDTTVASPDAGDIVVPDTGMTPFTDCDQCNDMATFTWDKDNLGTFDSNTNMCHGDGGCTPTGGLPNPDGNLVRLDLVDAGTGVGECVKRLAGLIPNRTYSITLTMRTDEGTNALSNSLTVTCGTAALFIIQSLGTAVELTATGTVTADSNGEITMTADAADGAGGDGHAGSHCNAISIVGVSL